MKLYALEAEDLASAGAGELYLDEAHVEKKDGADGCKVFDTDGFVKLAKSFQPLRELFMLTLLIW